MRTSDAARVLAAERLKLGKRRSTVAVPLAVAAFAAAIFQGLAFAAGRQWVGEPSGFYLAAAAAGWMVNVSALCAIIVTSFHISSEFDVGTIKSAWVRPISRRGWFAGKLISAWIMVGVIFLAALLVVLILAGTRFGFTDLMEKDYLVHSRTALSLRFAETTLLLLFSLVSVTTVMAAIAVSFRHPGASIAAGIGLVAAFVVLDFFPAARPFLLSTAITLPVEQIAAMAKGIPTPLAWGALAARTAACAAVWLLAAFAAGAAIVRTKEIHS